MKFDHELPNWKVQAIEVATQSEFVAIKQFDGSGEEVEHWVLVRKSQIPELIQILQQAQGVKRKPSGTVVGTVVDTAARAGQ